MKVPFLDMWRMHGPLEEEFVSSFRKILGKNGFTKGDELSQFEDNFKNWIGAGYCTGVGSGHDALVLGLQACGLKKGQKVIAPAMTFISTISSIIQAGGEPVLVDVDSQGLIDLDQAEALIQTGIDFIVPVHLYGQMVDPKRLKKLKDSYNIKIFEDCAQAHGAKKDGIKAGTIGDGAAFSFYPGKNLGALGDGGAFVTNNESYYTKMIALREHGQTKKYFHKYIGSTSRLDNIQAAFLDTKLRYMDEWNIQRINVAKTYHQNVNNSGLKLLSNQFDGSNVYHLMIATTDKTAELMNHLEHNKIGFGRHYPIPIHHLECFKPFGWQSKKFPNAEFIAYNSISLPVFPGMSDMEVEMAAQAINSFRFEELSLAS
jgi:dTDP-4-amino-4,6-dideoxygalactose transaminase